MHSSTAEGRRVSRLQGRRKGKEKADVRHLETSSTRLSSSLSTFLDTVDKGPSNEINKRGPRPAKRRKVGVKKQIKTRSGLLRRDSNDQEEEVSHINSDGALSDQDHHQLLHTLCPNESSRVVRISPVVRRRRVANRSRLLAVAQEINDIDNISSSENEEFPDTIVTKSIPSAQRGGGSSKVKAEDESNTSQIISNPSSNHPINISVFLGDVSTDKYVSSDKQVEGDEAISQESSSSEMETSPMVDRPSTSDWLKDQSLDTSCGPDLNKSVTPSKFASGKKSKYIKGGLAERLKQLTTQENSDISFWEHSHKQHQKKTSSHQHDSEPTPLIVHVTSVVQSCALFITDCLMMNDDLQLPPVTKTDPCKPPPTSEVLEGVLSQWKVCHSLKDMFPTRTSVKAIFTRRTASFLRLGVGSTVHIFPPWYLCCLGTSETPLVIFGTHFSTGMGPAQSSILDTDKHIHIKCSTPKQLFSKAMD